MSKFLFLALILIGINFMIADIFVKALLVPIWQKLLLSALS
ncbi:MAG: hypothetical protein V7L02_03870 [Nostoc sp.]